MAIQGEFEKLLDRLTAERDELRLKIHLASMDVKDEFEEAEKGWLQLKNRATNIVDGAVETSDEYIAKAKIVGEELIETYHRIAGRLRK